MYVKVIRPSFEVVKEGRIFWDYLSFYFFLRSLEIDDTLPSLISLPTPETTPGATRISLVTFSKL